MSFNPLGPLPGTNPLLSLSLQQFTDALTGVMTDQPFTLANTLTVANTFTASSGVTFSGQSSGGVLTVGAAGVLGTVAPGSSGNVLTSSGGVWASVAAAGAPITIVGPTFATANTTMTNSVTWYTGVTLGAALAAGGTYLISGALTIAATANDFIQVRLFDSTNSVQIGSDIEARWANANRMSYVISPIAYSGYSGTPTIVIQAYDATTGGSIIVATTDNGATNRACNVQAVKLG